MEFITAIKYFKSFEKILNDDKVPIKLNLIYDHIKTDDVLDFISNKIGKTNTLKFTFLYFFKKTGVNEKKYKDMLNKLRSISVIQYNAWEYTTEECNSCHGNGREDCEECNGDGKVECIKCDGDGNSTCPTCGGSGEDDEGNNCNECDGDETISCNRCDGDGKEYCDYCGGNGDFECGNCNGNGEYESDEKRYTPEIFNYVKIINDLDYHLENKANEINKIKNNLDKNSLCLFVGSKFDEYNDYDFEETKIDFKTSSDSFEILEIYNLI